MDKKSEKIWPIVVAVLALLYILGSCSNGGSSSRPSGSKSATCNYCHGTGRVNGGTCSWCGGSGRTYNNYFNDLLD